MLIIACPCVLNKNAEALERFEQIDTLVVDKTGTLTEGKPRVIATVPARGFDGARLLTLAASVERSSEHPLAMAIVASARERGLPLQDGTDFSSTTGNGVSGRIGSTEGSIGNAKLIDAATGSTLDLEQRADEYRRQGATVMYVAVNGQAAGILAVADPIKPSTPTALERLRADARACCTRPSACC